MPVTISGTSGVQLPLGSASAPSATNTTAQTTGVYYPTSTTLGLSTNGTAALTIDASQNVGIGTSSPSGNLEVKGASGQNIYVSYTGGSQLRMKSDSGDSGVGTTGATPLLFLISNAEKARIDTSGNLLVGTTSSPSNARFRAYGNASADFNFGPQTASGNNAFIVYNQSNVGVYLVSGNTSWTATSDERKKDIIEPITDAANKVSSLRAVIGKYKTDDEGTRRSFLIAQDVQAVLPEAVDATDSDNLGVSYTEVIPLLVAAIKELKATIDAQAAEIAALKAKVPA